MLRVSQGVKETVNHDERLFAGLVNHDIGAKLLDMLDQQIKLIVILDKLRNGIADAQSCSSKFGLDLITLCAHKNLQKAGA